MRAEREIDAVRERLQRDVERRVIQGQARLLREMLDVVDNLDRALAAADGAPAVGRGIELVRQQMLAILKGEGVEPLEMVGQPYDPNLAEAVLVEPVDSARDNLQKLLADSQSTLTAAALEASASPQARAARIARAAEPLLEATPEPEKRLPWRLRIEGLLREIDASFPQDGLPEPLPQVRDRLRLLLGAGPS